MAKKILIIVLRTVAILLVLVYMMALLFSNQSFLGKAITYLLMACLAILSLFFIYLMFTNMADAARKQRNDEENLNEKHIEKIFTGASIAKQKSMASPAPRPSSEQDPDWLEEEFLSIRKQAEYEAKLAAEAAAERKWQEEMDEVQRVDLETRIDRIARAEAAARRDANESLNEEDRRIARAEMEALQRNRLELQAQLDEQEEERRRKQQEEEARLRAEEEAAALRKTQAIESVRKQAEANAVARRRAAATSATQSMAPIQPPIQQSGYTTGGLPSLGATGAIPPLGATGRIPPLTEPAARQGQPSRAPMPPPSTPAALSGTQQNIWQQMNAPQTAASQGQPMGSTASFTYNSAPRPAVPQRTGAIPPVYATQSFAVQNPNPAAYHTGAIPINRTQSIPVQGGASPPQTAQRPAGNIPAAAQHTQQFGGIPMGAGPATAANAQRAAAARALGNTQSLGQVQQRVGNAQSIPVAARPPMSVTQQFSAAPQGTQQFTAPLQGTQSFTPPRQGTQPSAVPPRQGTQAFTPPQQSTQAFVPPRKNTQQQSTQQFAPVQQQGTIQFAPPQGSATPRPGYMARPAYSPPHQQTGQPVPQQYQTQSFQHPRESVTGAPAGAPPGGTAQGDLPRRRGRPPKPRTEEETNTPKRPRGRPPKPKTEEELNAPKRPRGRPPKVRTPEELAQMNTPKRPRGRPRKEETKKEDASLPDTSKEKQEPKKESSNT